MFKAKEVVVHCRLSSKAVWSFCANVYILFFRLHTLYSILYSILVPVRQTTCLGHTTLTDVIIKLSIISREPGLQGVAYPSRSREKRLRFKPKTSTLMMPISPEFRRRFRMVLYNDSKIVLNSLFFFLNFEPIGPLSQILLRCSRLKRQKGERSYIHALFYPSQNGRQDVHTIFYAGKWCNQVV